MYVCVCAQGVRGFYGGVSPALVGSVASWALYFFAYNEAKALMSTHAGATGTGAHMTSAAAAGVFVASVTNPIWLIKTRLQVIRRPGQTEYRGVADCAVKIFREEGGVRIPTGMLHVSRNSDFDFPSESEFQLGLSMRVRIQTKIFHASQNSDLDFREFQI